MTLGPKHHFLAGLFVASVSLLFSQSFPFIRFELFGVELTVFVLCTVISVIVDFDHIIDFRLNRNYKPMPLEDKFRKGRMFVVFHSFENSIILSFLSSFFPSLIFPTISYICHMIMDALGNNVSWQAYFYIFRFGRKCNKWNRYSHWLN